MSITKKNNRTDSQVKKEVRRHYGEFARRSVKTCCGDRDSLVEKERATIEVLYQSDQIEGLPVEVTLASAGCGNPTALASLRKGETVVDFGSGGGIDCFMAAQAVGVSGKVIGIDMTQDMIDLSRRNTAKVGATNVEFHLSEIDRTPLKDSSADVVISNCVICLVPDKDAVFSEAFRILRPGGRLFVSDMVLSRESPKNLTLQPGSLGPCESGAETIAEYLQRLGRIGYQNVEIISEVPYVSDEIPSLTSLSYTAHKPS